MYWLIGSLCIAVLLLAPVIGVFAQPWAPVWFGIRDTSAPVPIGDSGGIDPGLLGGGHVSDAERYQLARMAGWSAQDAITATAISIAENGSGIPSLLSGVNRNGTRDLGLWQINSAWWPQFGGQATLSQPWPNAQAAFAIYGRQGWCAWSTYEVSCGVGHTGDYRSHLERARRASLVRPTDNQT